jgi:hypothetical protein
MVCSICSSSAGVFGPYGDDGIIVCDGCASRIGELVSKNASLAWTVAESGPLSAALEDQAASMATLTESLGAGKLIVDARDTPLPWSELVAAFVDRRLYHFAVRTCGVMMKRAPEDKEIALRNLLSPPLIQRDGVAAIRLIIRRESQAAAR